MDSIISVQHLGKKYFIRHQKEDSYETLRDTIVKKTQNIIKKIRGQGPGISQREEFWALKDINFEVQKGDRLGIIGRNGAGKSTLLKILSRITEPTTGKIILHGRVSSLLEVGTGFHPELTGRENIFLNGAILGMRRTEIKRYFSDIVDFAEIKDFLDTPVKRYSSGMYVRLAFSVAAHLQPEILIVDEVLAVGDAQFQKKCIGKMEDVSRSDERTVLFVSHNMSTIKQLCNRVLLLKDGQLKMEGEVEKVIAEYLKEIQTGGLNRCNFAGPLTSIVEFHSISINGIINNVQMLHPSSEIRISITGICKKDFTKFKVTVSIYKDEARLFTLMDVDQPELLPRGNFRSQMVIPPYFLRPGLYSIAIGGYNDTLFGDEWLFGTGIQNFEILQEWDEKNPWMNLGTINLNANGKREINLKDSEF